MALKNVGKHFILWPKQGNKIGGVVLNKVRISNSKRLTYTQILVKFPPGISAIQNRVYQKWSARVLKWRGKGLSSWYAQCLLTYTFESVDEILKCDHSNTSYWAELSCGTFIMLYKVVLTFKSVVEILKCDHLSESNWAVLSSRTIYILYKVVLTFV